AFPLFLKLTYQRRRRPVSTTSSRSTWALRLSLSIRTVLNNAPHSTRRPSPDAYEEITSTETPFADGKSPAYFQSIFGKPGGTRVCCRTRPVMQFHQLRSAS